MYRIILVDSGWFLMILGVFSKPFCGDMFKFARCGVYTGLGRNILDNNLFIARHVLNRFGLFHRPEDMFGYFCHPKVWEIGDARTADYVSSAFGWPQKVQAMVNQDCSREWRPIESRLWHESWSRWSLNMPELSWIHLKIHCAQAKWFNVCSISYSNKMKCDMRGRSLSFSIRCLSTFYWQWLTG